MSANESFLNNFRISYRLGVGIAIVVGLFIVQLILIGQSFYTLEEEVGQIKNETLPQVLTVDEMDTARSEVQQWLTDVSATHNRDGYKDADAAASRFLAGINKFRSIYQGEANAQRLQELAAIEASFNTFNSDGRSMAERYITEGIESGNVAMEDFDAHSERIATELSKFRKDQVEEANAIVAEAIASADNTMTLMTLGGLITTLLATIAAVIVSRSIIVPIRNMEATMIEIGKHYDLTRRIDLSSQDEIGHTARSFNDMMSKLQSTMNELRLGVDRIFQATGELSSSSHQVATGSVHQSEETASIAATIEQVTVSINHVSDSARDALQQSRESGELSDRGSSIIHKAASEMSQIADTVRQTSVSIANLGEQSNQISTIVQVIKEIAEQTNLLALNAAIEAARAGEQGRGFAVVADEVRKLAERTSGATEEITQMIVTIQDTAQIAVGTMSSAVSRVDAGVALANEAGQSITLIRNGAESVIDTVETISAALVEQSAASNDIANHVEKVAQMTEENSTAAESTSREADDLSALANRMRTAINQFKC